MKPYPLIACFFMTGCAVAQDVSDKVQDTVIPAKSPDAQAAREASRAQARRDKEMTRRYTICMKQTLGPFSGFASPESRRKASEQCKSVMQADSSGATAATNP